LVGTVVLVEARESVQIVKREVKKKEGNVDLQRTTKISKASHTRIYLARHPRRDNFAPLEEKKR
jgi:hypothetical protein